MDRYTLHLGDCLETLRAMPVWSVDSIVTDPPYALPGGFMGKSWDNHDGREDAGFGYWLAGFTDGEGCFRVQRHERGTHTCAFQIKLRDDDRAVLERIRRFVGAGTIAAVDDDSPSKPQARYVVQDKDECARLVALFRKHPLTAKKALDFEVWTEAVEEWLDRPRGSRWHGAADQTRAAALKARLENVRKYTDVPWSGHKFQDWVRQWSLECLRVLKPGGHMLAFGAPRQYHRLACGIEDAGFEVRDTLGWVFGSGFPKSHNLSGDWEGWGTALKPAWESIVLARKPLTGTVAVNLLAHGAGALNIDGCRIETSDNLNGGTYSEGGKAAPMPGDERKGAALGMFASGAKPKRGYVQPTGRWPANLIHDGSDEVAALFPAEVGQSTARFFYAPKTSRKDRNEGLQDPGPQFKHGATLRQVEKAATTGNTHPTVKPTDLMAYLCRLVTPPGGIVLDPFMGSGSTGKAAMREGFQFIGCELEESYMAIAKARINHETDRLEAASAAPSSTQLEIFA